MKNFLKAIGLWIGLPSLVLGAVPPYFNNYGVLNQTTNISAVHFNNFGLIDFDGSFTVAFPYSTYGTAFFTNTGSMIGVPGFRFENVGTKTITPSTSFFNRGSVIGEDGGGFINIGVGGIGGGTIASDITVNAKNIINQGTIQVGPSGGTSLTGKNIDLSYGIIRAGANTTPSVAGTEQAEFYAWDTTPKLFCSAAPNTFDLLWGTTNGLPGRIPQLVTPDPVAGLYDVQLPGFFATNRGDGVAFSIPIFDQGLTAFVFSNAFPAGQMPVTNYYYDVVLLNTSFPNDPNTSVNVQFGDPTVLAGFQWVPPAPNTTPTGNFNGVPIVVTYSETTVDPITGQPAVNSVYIEDDGDTVSPILFAQNANYAAAYGRPCSFEVSFTAPFPDDLLLPSNTDFDPGQIYTPNEMGLIEAMTNAVYEVQIGNNPENLAGSFPALTGVESLNDIPDPTNAPGRVTINADNLHVHNLKLAASGLVEVNATNFTGIPSVFNYGTANLNLQAKTNSLVISNMVPTLFEELRGNIEMWSGTWDNMQTNDLTTNTIHTHVLYIAQNLSAQYTPTVRNFHLKGTNMVIQSDVEVIRDTIFNGRNLTVMGNLYLTEQAQNFFPSAAPNLRNLFVTNGASFAADSVIDVGLPLPITVKSPIGRGYSVLTITNEGTLSSTALTLQAATIDNDGTAQTENNGSIIMAAKTLNLGAAGLSAANEIDSGGTVTLSANSILVSNNTINADQIVLTPVKELTDFVTPSAGASPNAVSDVVNPNAGELVNFWTVTNGIDLTRKAATGDLYGTQIQLLAFSGPPVVMTWAGTDRGPTAAGFINNAVVGTLILDRKTNDAILQFNAAGNKNALYVNNLTLEDFSATDYTNNTFVDPRLTIYFASANVPVEKITNISPRFVYAPDVASSVARAAVPPSVPVSRGGTGGPIVASIAPPVGVYSGLFSPPSGATSSDSGFLTFALDKNGTFSGRILLGSAVIPFSSRLSGGGASFAVGTLAVDFVIDSAGHLAGEVTGEGWNSELAASMAGAAPCPYAGRYSISLPGSSGAASAGHVSVSPQGVVTVSGKLADGAAFSQSTRLSQDGQWPFFAYSPAGKDVLQGWLNFSQNPGQVTGSVNWTKPGKATGANSQGFEDVVQVSGVKAQ